MISAALTTLNSLASACLSLIPDTVTPTLKLELALETMLTLHLSTAVLVPSEESTSDATWSPGWS
jgi:hypothetical protein